MIYGILLRVFFLVCDLLGRVSFLFYVEPAGAKPSKGFSPAPPLPTQPVRGSSTCQRLNFPDSPGMD